MGVRENEDKKRGLRKSSFLGVQHYAQLGMYLR